jgi:hypothetical protein
MAAYAAVGVTKVWVGPPGPDPVAWTTEVAERVVPRLAEL